MDQSSNLLQEKNLNKLGNNQPKMGMKHQSSHGNIKAMAVRTHGHHQSQIFHKTSKTHFQIIASKNTEKENSHAVSYVQQQNNYMSCSGMWG
jgi:hypothetical protein